MSIKYAILGLLSSRPMTGYDLKKMIQASPFMHWSGNNNQIYKSLVELLEEGFVTSELKHQESSPSKKIYTITEEGSRALREWVLAAPELPERKKTFFVQLAWADQLNTEELNSLLSRYEDEIRLQVVYHRELIRRGSDCPGRTPREVIIWDSIYGNILASYEQELDWISKLRTELGTEKEEEKVMDYKLYERNDVRYIDFSAAGLLIQTEQDANDLIAVCFEHKTSGIILSAEAFTDDFYKLRTGLAGAILQKFVNYHAKVAIVFADDARVKGKFKEFLEEANRGKEFRSFGSREDAENWLVNG